MTPLELPRLSSSWKRCGSLRLQLWRVRGIASDDDDESFHVDTSSWAVPLKDLKIPEKGKLPAHLLYACAIVGTPQVRPHHDPE